MSYQYVLASKSPRRKELLGLLKIPFDICPAVGEERSRARIPSDYVQELAEDKAEEVYDRFCREHREAVPVVIGSDTIVVCDQKILGKPKDRADAYRMISMLQGRSHHAMTGVSVIWKKEDGTAGSLRFFESTEVHVCPMTEEEINAYIDTPIPYDKAGAYGIQSEFGIYISGIEGDYNNVVGLPIARLYQELKRHALL